MIRLDKKMETKLKIIHETVYKFNSNVYIEPHYLRFQPRTTPYNKLESIDFKIFPTPSGLSGQSDAEDNLIHFCWFDGMYTQLDIRSESIVVLQEHDPLNFNLYPAECYDWPWQYGPQSQRILPAALSFYTISNALIAYGNEILASSYNKTIDFLINLTSRVYADFTAEARMQGEPYSPETTFYLKKGSCRDLAWMQIQLVRYFGIAAKFVSGYYFTNLGNMPFELHAWLEVYLPGAGWIGFDPSNGILAGSAHISVCSSAHHQNTMPITGSYRGGADSTMDTVLSIVKI